jgi:cell division protease FtsH
MIDDEVRLLSENAYNRVKKLLTERMPEVKMIAEALLQKEVLYKDDLERLIGKRPFEEHSIHDDATTIAPIISNEAEIKTEPALPTNESTES